MGIIVNDTWTALELKKRFSARYPYLAIEPYFRHTKNYYPEVSKKSMIPETKTLADCRLCNNPRIISIVPGMTIAELVHTFQDVYGIFLKVQRKSGRAWLDISLTANWTLEQQNNLGEELCQYIERRQAGEFPIY